MKRFLVLDHYIRDVILPFMPNGFNCGTNMHVITDRLPHIE